MKRQRIFSALTAAVMGFALLSGQTARPEAAAIAGDVNGDGVVTVVDCIIMQGWLLRHDNIEMYAPENADINGDGIVDIFDLALCKHIVITNGTADFPTESTESTESTEATGTSDTTEPPVKEGKLYQRVGAVDPYAQITVFQTLLPEGWTLDMASSWTGNYSYTWPGVEVITMTSPDGKGFIRIQSPRQYSEDLMLGKTGASISDNTIYAPYLNADKYVQNAVQSAFSSTTLTKDFEDNPDVLSAMQTQTQYYAQTTYDKLTFGNYYVASIQDMQSTMCRQQYRSDTEAVEFSCAVNMYKYSAASTLLPTYVTSYYNIWWVPYTVMYYAEDPASFDKYYSDYEIITGNSCFTKEFYAMNEYVAARREYIELAARTESQNEWMNGVSSEFFNEGYSSETSLSAQEQIFQAWDDYIKDENAYTFSDGSTVRVPNSIEAMAQNGDSVYFGSSVGVPSGYDILTAN